MAFWRRKNKPDQTTEPGVRRRTVEFTPDQLNPDGYLSWTASEILEGFLARHLERVVCVSRQSGVLTVRSWVERRWWETISVRVDGDAPPESTPLYLRALELQNALTQARYRPQNPILGSRVTVTGDVFVVGDQNVREETNAAVTIMPPAIDFRELQKLAEIDLAAVLDGPAPHDIDSPAGTIRLPSEVLPFVGGHEPGLLSLFEDLDGRTVALLKPRFVMANPNVQRAVLGFPEVL